MIFKDDRTPAQKVTHYVIVLATDKFMSGWGYGVPVSFAGWACRYEDLNKVEQWVRSRREMKRVRFVGNDYRPKGRGHCHIYVVEEGHPALS